MSGTNSCRIGIRSLPWSDCEYNEWLDNTITVIAATDWREGKRAGAEHPGIPGMPSNPLWNSFPTVTVQQRAVPSRNVMIPE